VVVELEGDIRNKRQVVESQAEPIALEIGIGPMFAALRGKLPIHRSSGNTIARRSDKRNDLRKENADNHRALRERYPRAIPRIPQRSGAYVRKRYSPLRQKAQWRARRSIA